MILRRPGSRVLVPHHVDITPKRVGIAVKHGALGWRPGPLHMGAGDQRVRTLFPTPHDLPTSDGACGKETIAVGGTADRVRCLLSDVTRQTFSDNLA